MEQLSVPLDVRKDSTKYSKLIAELQYHQLCMDDFFFMVSAGLQNKVNTSLLEQLVHQHEPYSFFWNLGKRKDSILYEVNEMSKLVHLQERVNESMLFMAQDKCNGLYFLIKGELEISVL